MIRAKAGFFMKIFNKTGFTLIELMMVLVIMGILSAIVSPNLIRYMAERRLNGAARMVMSDLMNARMLAVTLNRNVQVIFPTSASASYTYDAAGTAAARNIQTGFGYQDVTVSATSNLTFAPTGRLSGALGSTVTLTSAALTQPKTLTVSSAGRVAIN